MLPIDLEMNDIRVETQFPSHLYQIVSTFFVSSYIMTFEAKKDY